MTKSAVPVYEGTSNYGATKTNQPQKFKQSSLDHGNLKGPLNATPPRNSRPYDQGL